MAADKMECPLKYRIYALVEFKGGFPIDMLRYDHCFPCQERDADIVEHSLSNPTIETKKVYVRSYSDHTSFNRNFTIDRWKSFGCNIKESSLSEVFGRDGGEKN